MRTTKLNRKKTRFLLCFLTLLIALSTFSTFALTPVFWKTQQNIPVVFYQTHHTPAATIHVAFKAGSAFDKEQFGLAALTTAMLDQGNDGITANQLANELAESGAIFAATTNRDMADYSLTTLTEPSALQKALQQFRRILTRPDFPTNAFDQQKAQQLGSILEEKDSPEATANNLFFEALYGNHPYGHPILGTPDSLKPLQLKACADFYRRYYVAENALIVVVGDLTLKATKQLADHLLETLPHGTPAPAIPIAAPLVKSKHLRIPFHASQTALYIGQLGITHHDPRYFALIVGNYILGGGGLVSRLSEGVREQKGLTYGISSDFLPMPGKGPFLIALSTQQNQATLALELTQSLLKNYVQSGPTASEVEAAKQYLIGSFPLTFASNSGIANVLLRLAFYQMPHNFLETYVPHIQAVTTTDITSAFQQTIHPNQLLTLSVGSKT